MPLPGSTPDAPGPDSDSQGVHGAHAEAVAPPEAGANLPVDFAPAAAPSPPSFSPFGMMPVAPSPEAAEVPSNVAETNGEGDGANNPPSGSTTSDGVKPLGAPGVTEADPFAPPPDTFSFDSGAPAASGEEQLTDIAF